MLFEEIKKLILDEYASTEPIIYVNRIKIEEAHPCLLEFAFSFWPGEKKEFYQSIGKTMRDLEILALDKEYIKQYSFNGKLIPVEQLFNITKIDEPLKQKIKNFGEQNNNIVLFDREPLQVFPDKEEPILIVYICFGYQAEFNFR